MMFHFAEEMYCDEKALGNKSTKDKPLKSLPKSPAIMASGISMSTSFIPSNSNELCDKVKYLLQDKQAEKTSDLTNEELVAKADKLLEYKCISTKQHKVLLLKCLN